jgi:LmbE family N-acetylglucosaminyl deacetylase
MSLADFGVTVVLAPHPDDETLGCGATLLRLKQETRSTLHWILMTRMSEAAGYDSAAIARRDREIDAVSKHYGFGERVQLPFGAATLDSEPTAITPAPSRSAAPAPSGSAARTCAASCATKCRRKPASTSIRRGRPSSRIATSR